MNRRGIRTVATVALLTTVVGLGHAPAGAVTSGAAISGSMTLSPSSGRVPTTFTASVEFPYTDPASGRVTYYPCDSSKTITLSWDGTPISSTLTGTTPQDAAVGGHSVTVDCTPAFPPGAAPPPFGHAASRFVVDPPPTTTTTTTTSTVPSTTAPTTTTTTPGTTATTAPASSSATTTSSTATTTTTDTTLPGDTVPTTSSRAGRGVELDRSASPPGGIVAAVGNGCDPDAKVTLLIGAREVGESVADHTGHFEAKLDLPDLDVGRYLVRARCGPTLTTTLDIVLASRVDRATSTLLVLVFFVLLGAALARRQLVLVGPGPHGEGQP